MNNKKPAGNKATVEVFKSKLHKSAKLVSIISLIVILIIILFVVGHRSPLKIFSSPKPLTNSQLIQRVATLTQSNKYNQAQQTINDSINPQSESSMILSAEIYFKQGNYKQSISVYKSIENRYGVNESIDVNIAEMAAMANDKTTALEYYQKAIELLKSQPNSSQSINQLQTQINKLM